MDERSQAEGEKRVRTVLLDPLIRLGLVRPSTLTVAGFDVMQDELCQRLAYLHEDELTLLRERIEAHPGGKEGDRFPPGPKILKWATEIRVPQSDGSPFIRKVFASPVGEAALDSGYAPELLEHIRKHRGEWPGAWTISKLRDMADEPHRRMVDIELRLSRGDPVTPEEQSVRDRRRAAIRKCEEIRGAAMTGDAA